MVFPTYFFILFYCHNQPPRYPTHVLNTYKNSVPADLGGEAPQKGAVVHLKELSISHKEQFQETEIELYGKRDSIRYYCIDLLWGQQLHQELRFVLVEMNGIQSILASTSLALNPLSVIRLYMFIIK